MHKPTKRFFCRVEMTEEKNALAKAGTKHQTEDSRRAQILETATRCFIEYGYHKTTMKLLVEQLGLSKGAIYHYYDSKEEILVALVDYWDTHFQEEFKRLVGGDDYVASFKKYCVSHFDFFIMYRNLNQVFFEMRGVERFDSALKNSWQETIVAIEDMLRSSSYMDRERKLTPNQAATAVTALLEGHLYHSTINKSYQLEKEFENSWPSIELLLTA